MSYAKLSKKKEPNRILVDLVSKLKKTGKALDVGAGPLIESKFLLKSGFDVDAYDKDLETAKKAEDIKDDNFNFYLKTIQDSNLDAEIYDLVLSFLTLPFVPPNEFNLVIKKILATTKVGGYVVVSLFGKRDGWAKNHSDMTFLSRKQVVDLFKSGFEIERFIEEDKIGLTVDGNTKKWHIFSVVAKKIN